MLARSTAFALTLCLPVAALADEAPDASSAPYFLIKSDDPHADRLPLESTKADVYVAGTIAHVRVTQTYKNEGSGPIEAVYVFPGSTRSAVFGMRMTIGDRTVVAKIERKDEARRIYNKARQQGKSASLLEQKRPNVFQMNVANIMPGDRVIVRLDYTELIVPERGVYTFTYPTVVGPRYSNASSHKSADAWVSNPHGKAGGASSYKWDLTAKISSGVGIQAVTSATHRISPSFQSSTAVKVDVEDPQGGNRDFVLKYRLAGDAIESGLVLLPGAKENFFLMMLEPPKRLEPSMIPPREYIFVVDVSGSMHGFPLDVSKQMMRELFKSLRPQDKFNVLLFAGGSRMLGERSVPATKANLKRAFSLLGRRRGGGSTRLLPAMKRALSLPRDENMSTSMVVLTDGYVTVEKATFELIRNNLGTANLFAFGIGSSVNRYIIEGMARAGMGEPFVVLNRGEAKAKADRFRRYIQSPVLTNIKVAIDGFDAYDVEPKRLPDLFGERPVVMFGKYRGAPTGTVRVSGVNGHGSWSSALDVSAFKPSDDNVALRYLWARHRIARLADYGRLRQSADTKSQITQLGLRYNLMTAHTSFVAVDSLIRNHSGASTTVAQPVPLPKGVSNLAGGSVGYRRSTTINFDSANVQGELSKPSGAYLRRSRRGKSPRRAPAPPASSPATRAPSAGDFADASSEEQSISRAVRAKPRPSVRGIGAATVRGSISRRAIQSVIRTQRGRIVRLYEKALQSNPNLGGKLVVEFTIDNDGRVKNVRITSNSLGDASIERRIKAVFARMRFPKPSGGGEVKVKYPLLFNLR